VADIQAPRDRRVYGRNAHFCKVTAFYEPTNEHAAPTELGGRARDVGSYRDYAREEAAPFGREQEFRLRMK
jgi:hypothetical protein